ncbi:MAG: 4-(cytidine 5'-diphospho)-2-C-methyl-D-erythritol kinase [Bacteroidota bacterium]
MSAVTVQAPAKVNLTLHVTGKRADGYHLLESLVAFAGIGDTLDLAAADGLSLALAGPTAAGLSAADDNIVLKAARALAAAAGIAPHAAITLTKRLPVAAGIGGGSADAAAALRGLVRLWGLDIAEDDLRALGLTLGADVPVCLAGHPTAMTGVGECLTPAPTLPPAWLVLVNPRRPLSTPAVFKARTGGFSAPAPLTESPADAHALAVALAARRNDLTQAAITLEPVLADMLALIAAQPGCLLARMSGSGATCFGLFADATTAQPAAAALTAIQPGWWIAAPPLLP